MGEAHDDTLQGPLAARLAVLRTRIANAALRAGRDPASVTLIAVTKTVAAPRVAEAVLAGIRDVGENRVQEAAAKIPELENLPPIRWHLIGHLQRNKVRRATELFAVIHSIDTVALAQAVSRHVEAGRAPVEAFVQVNVSGESTKSGLDLETLHAAGGMFAALPGMRWRGLMTIAPALCDTETVRAVFAATRRAHQDLAPLFDARWWDALSMGMSDDFEVAIEEGATHIRVGRALFGER